VLFLVQIKTNQAVEIEKLKQRVKKLEGKKKKRTRRLKRLYKVGLTARVESFKEEKAGENVEQDATIAKKEVSAVESVEGITAATTLKISKDDVTLAQTLIEIKAVKPMARGVTIQESSEFRTISPSQLSQPPQAKDKGKEIMVEPEEPLKKKDQIALNEEVARKLEAHIKAKMEEEERIEKEEDEANIALIEEWDDVQSTIDADRQLVEQLQTQEREQLSIEERSKLLAELIESRKKYFAAKRAKEINKPPTKAQQKSLMYSEVMEGSKKTQEEVTEGSSKRVGDEIEQESAKRQRLEKEGDNAELKRCLEIVLEDDDYVTIKATPISSKSPTIVDYKIYKEGKKSYFKIIRANGNSQNYLTFETMFKNFNIEDLEVLRSIVKEGFKTKPVNDMDNILFQTLKIMFEHHIEDNIWKYQQGVVKVHNWKLYDSYGTKILIKKLEDSEGEHQVYGRIIGIKGLHRVTTAQKLRLLRDEDIKYAK
nr:hypothetical protein [Tanacetum cinerariifolium]